MGGKPTFFPQLTMAAEDLRADCRKTKAHDFPAVRREGAALAGIQRTKVQERRGGGMTASAVSLSGEDADKNLDRRWIAATGGGRFYMRVNDLGIPATHLHQGDRARFEKMRAAVDAYFQPTQITIRRPDSRPRHPTSKVHHISMVTLRLQHIAATRSGKYSLRPGITKKPLLARWRVGLGWDAGLEPAT
jgi:hypothetical protein